MVEERVSAREWIRTVSRQPVGGWIVTLCDGWTFAIPDVDGHTSALFKNMRAVRQFTTRQYVRKEL